MNGLEKLTGWYLALMGSPEPIEEPNDALFNLRDGGPTYNHLAWMLMKIPHLPYPKACRWLGFVQGVLTCRGFASIEGQRNATRELLQKLDANKGGQA